MNQDVIKIDQDDKQIIFANYRYQKNEKKSNLYRCVNRICGVIFNPGTLKTNSKEHFHSPLSQCEIDCIIHVKQLITVVSLNHDINLVEAYNSAYQKLIIKYSYQELADNVELNNLHITEFQNLIEKNTALIYF